MSETKFTPGPWIAHLGWESDGGQLDSEHPDWCEVTGAEGLSIIGHYGIANANLIAAAPDLYEALQAAVNMVDTDQGPPNWDWLRSVLRKARGEQP